MQIEERLRCSEYARSSRLVEIETAGVVAGTGTHGNNLNLIQELQRFITIVGDHDVEPVTLQISAYNIAHDDVVIGDQHASHGNQG